MAGEANGCGPKTPNIDDEFDFEAGLRSIEQHSPAVDLCNDLLQKAKTIVEVLMDEEGQHVLNNRFVIQSTGTDAYPFEHYRIELKHKKKSLAKVVGIDGIMLRFGLRSSPGDEAVSAIVVSVGLVNGLNSDYVLTNNAFEPFASPDELEVINGVLQGVQKSSGESGFNSDTFKGIVEDMEPVAQSNSTD